MIYQVDQQQLILAVAQELKNHIEMPGWALYAKTGAHRETVPRNPDWWYIRAASILRVCFKEGPVGVSKLRTRYGGRKNRGMKPDKFALAGGKVIRTILQQLEKAELIKQHVVEKHKGRIATPKGVAILAKAAKKVGITTPATANIEPAVSEQKTKKETVKQPEKQTAKKQPAEKKTENQNTEKQTADKNAEKQTPVKAPVADNQEAE